jgi:hypothetical protein
MQSAFNHRGVAAYLLPTRTPSSQPCRYITASTSGGCFGNECTDMALLGYLLMNLEFQTVNGLIK